MDRAKGEDSPVIGIEGQNFIRPVVGTLEEAVKWLRMGGVQHGSIDSARRNICAGKLLFWGHRSYELSRLQRK